jgi:hypothetical protein
MKKIILMTLALVAFVFTACEKESLGVSKITTYPTIELKGDVAMTILVGETYTEPGFTALEGDKDITSSAVVEGTVDGTTPGVYVISYTATNSDGFSYTARRYVGVITPDAAAMDISGQYQRTAGAFGIATVTKTKYPGLYINNNPGGIVIKTEADNINVYMFHTDVHVVSVPSQDSKVGEFACINGTYNVIEGKPQYSWVCINSGYGEALRIFIKL